MMLKWLIGASISVHKRVNPQFRLFPAKTVN